MQSGPREIVTPFRPIPLDVPATMAPNEFFNSAENLEDLTNNNGLLLIRRTCRFIAKRSATVVSLMRRLFSTVPKVIYKNINNFNV